MLGFPDGIVDIFERTPRRRRPNRTDQNREINRHVIQVMKQLRRSVSGRPGIKDLRGFLDLPLDMIYEVLTHLHPLDLHHLSRTTKQLRAFTLSRESAPVWQLAFQNYPDLPPCPSDISEPKWTDLLFGAYECDACGMEGTIPECCVRWRLCFGCIYSMRDLLLRDPSYQASLKAKGNPESLSWFHNMPELIDEIQDIQFRLLWDVEGSSNQLENLKADLKIGPLVQSIIEIDEACVRWTKELENEAFEELRRDWNQVIKIVNRRLTREGYQVDDILNMCGNNADDALPFYWAWGIDELNPMRSMRREWSRIRLTIKSMLDEFIRKRKEQERRFVVRERLLDIQSNYSYHLLHTSVRNLHSPPKEEITHYELFLSMIEDPSEFYVDVAELEQRITAFISNWPPRSLNDLAAILPSFTSPYAGLPDSPDMFSASSVFSCQECREPGMLSHGWCLIGWEERAAHKSCSRGIPPPILPHGRGCAAAASLLNLLNLDINTRSAELDQQNLVFGCSVCNRKGRYERYSWRQCIFHYMETESDKTHLTPQWYIMDAEEQAVVDAYKREVTRVEEEAFYCISDML